MTTVEDPRRYVRAMNFIRAKIEDGKYKPHELIPPIGELAGETGHSRHTISKALRLLQDEGLVTRTPGLGYCPTTRAPNSSGRLTRSRRSTATPAPPSAGVGEV